MVTNFRVFLRALVVGAVLNAGWAGYASGADLFDDFEDGVIDTTKWIPRPAWAGSSRFKDSAVEEIGGQLVLRNRGYLVTAEQFDPAAGLLITGRATFPTLPPLGPPFFGGDWFQLATRSDGMPDVVPNTFPGNEWGEVGYGVEFLLIADSDTPNWRMQIWEHVESFRTRLVSGAGLPNLGAGVPFSFRVNDDGVNVSFSVWDEHEPNVVYTAEGTSSFRSPGGENYVALYNREMGRMWPVENVLALDHISIVPEPASIVLALLGLVAIIVGARRSRWAKRLHLAKTWIAQ